ncbi:hypothetical protein M0R45_034885 [Rubus argutus]|uniref:Uncharacterized protein n=1 Tax=Rubus argutus TaxID=59490 RepID=A0AAW1VSJ0_RUBAR
MNQPHQTMAAILAPQSVSSSRPSSLIHQFQQANLGLPKPSQAKQAITQPVSILQSKREEETGRAKKKPAFPAPPSQRRRIKSVVHEPPPSWRPATRDAGTPRRRPTHKEAAPP